MATVTRKFKPNTDIVKVKIDGLWKHYEITTSVDGYIRKCNADGKEAVYAGKTNSNGKLK